MSLLLGGTLGVDCSRLAVCTLMHVWHMMCRLVVTDDVLPSVALLTQDGIAIIVREATDALDSGGLFFFDSPVSWGRAVGVCGWKATVEGEGSRLRVSMRLDGRDVRHTLAGDLWERELR